jgi:hypothetical protein
MKKTNKIIKLSDYCSICGAKLDKLGGHSAAPVTRERACDHCNLTVVLPARARVVNKEINS